MDGAAGEYGGGVVRPQFHGSAGAMFPVVLKGLLLTFLTLGIYRFWYVTNVRRFMWTNTTVDGDGLEYTGRGVELFIGFLIALAVLIPFYGIGYLAGLAVGAIGAGVVQSVLSIGLLVLAQFALYRARRYRLNRTIWRGIRFQQSGSGFVYAFKSILWGLLALFTLGLAYPFMRASLERYKMKHTWYGDQQGAFAGTGFGLLKRGFFLWLLVWVLVIGPFAGIGLLGSTAQAGGISQEMAGIAMSALGFLAFLAAVVLFPVYQGIEFRWWADGSSVGPATARSDLGLFAFFRVYLGYFGVLILFGIGVAVVGGAVGAVAYTTGVFAEESGPSAGAIVFGAIAVLLYLLAGLILAALWQLFGARPIWRKSFESVEIAGLAALTAAQSQQPEANAFGEGVADALDFGGF